MKNEADGMVPVCIPISVREIFRGLAVYHKVAGGILVEAADNIQQRRLSAAGVPQYRNKIVFPEFKIYPLQRVDD